MAAYIGHMLSSLTVCLQAVRVVFLRLSPQGIDRVSQLWDQKRDSGPASKMSVQLHLAKMAAFRAAGRHTEVRAVGSQGHGGSGLVQH